MSKTQQDLLREIRRKLGLTNRELAQKLGLPVNATTGESATLLAWLAPEKAAKHRTMPVSAMAKLDQLLRAKRK